MATYVYETVPEPGGEPVRTYEFKQSMKDAAYTRHPETGEPIRRVISGGMGILAGSKGGSPAPRGGGHFCGSGCGCG